LVQSSLKKSEKEIKNLINSIKKGNIEELFKWIVQKEFDLDSALPSSNNNDDGGGGGYGDEFQSALHIAVKSVSFF
jgi:hypothetical protein